VCPLSTLPALCRRTAVSTVAADIVIAGACTSSSATTSGDEQRLSAREDCARTTAGSAGLAPRTLAHGNTGGAIGRTVEAFSTRAAPAEPGSGIAFAACPYRERLSRRHGKQACHRGSKTACTAVAATNAWIRSPASATICLHI